MIQINKIGFSFSCFLIILGLCNYVLMRTINLLLPVFAEAVSEVLRREINTGKFIVDLAPLEWLALGVTIIGIIFSILFYFLERKRVM